MNNKYCSGDWVLDTSRHLLSNKQQSITLEPRILALLEYFLKNPKRTIHRDELIEHVWQGTSVSESAINWTIAQLRKSLGDNAKPREYIQTLPKQGYQWLKSVEIETQEVPGAASVKSVLSDENTKTNKRSFHLVFLILLTVTFGSIIWLMVQSAKTTQPLTGFANPFTSLPGNEGSPGFSPDGQWLVFTHYDYQTKKSRLMLKAVAEAGEFLKYDRDNKAQKAGVPSERLLPESVLVNDSDFIRTPSWAPHSKQLAFMQINQGECQIRLLTFNRLMEVADNQLIHTCSSDGYSQVSWGSNSDQFYFTDRIDDSPYQIWRYEVSQNKATPITQITESIGFHLIRVSPTREEALVIKDINRTRSEFYLMDLITGDSEQLMVQKGVYYDLDWNADGSAFYFNYGQQNLYRFDRQSRNASLFYSVTSNEVYGMVQSPNKLQYAFVTASTNKNRIDWFDLNGKKMAVAVDSTYQERLPYFSSAKDLLYFVSDRSGLPQIWTKQTNGQEQQVSNSTDYYLFGSVRVSKDGAHVIGESDGGIHTMSLQKESTWIHTSPEDQAANPIFSENLQFIIYSLLIEGDWQLVKVPYTSQITTPELLTQNGGYFSALDDDGNLYFTKKDQCGLWLLNMQESTEQLVSEDVCISSNSLVIIEGTLFYEDFKSKELGIYQFNLNDKTRLRLIDRNEYPGKGFSVDIKNQRLAVHRFIPVEADILMIKKAAP